MIGDFIDSAKKFAIEAVGVARKLVKPPTPFEALLDEALHCGEQTFGSSRGTMNEIARCISYNHEQLEMCREDIRGILCSGESTAARKIKACALLSYILVYCKSHVVAEMKHLTYALRTTVSFCQMDSGGQRVKEKVDELLTILNDPEALEQFAAAVIQKDKKFGGVNLYGAQEAPPPISEGPTASHGSLSGFGHFNPALAERPKVVPPESKGAALPNCPPEFAARRRVMTSESFEDIPYPGHRMAAQVPYGAGPYNPFAKAEEYGARTGNESQNVEEFDPFIRNDPFASRSSEEPRRGLTGREEEAGEQQDDPFLISDPFSVPQKQRELNSTDINVDLLGNEQTQENCAVDMDLLG